MMKFFCQTYVCSSIKIQKILLKHKNTSIILIQYNNVLMEINMCKRKQFNVILVYCLRIASWIDPKNIKLYIFSDSDTYSKTYKIKLNPGHSII